MFKFWEHQKKGIHFLVTGRTRKALFFGTGSGKTMVSIGAYSHLSRNKLIDGCVILVDRSSIVPFMSDIEDNTRFSYTVIEKASDLQIKADLYLLPKTRLSKLCQALPSIGSKMLLILDECHSLKNWDSQFSQTVSYMLNKWDKNPFLYSYFLTASPVKKDIFDLFGQINVIEPSLFGGYYQFVRDYCIMRERKANVRMWTDTNKRAKTTQKRKIKELIGIKNTEKLKIALSKTAMFHYVDYGDRVNFNKIPVEITDSEMAYYVECGVGLDFRKTIKIKDKDGSIRDYLDDSVGHGVRTIDLQLAVDMGECKEKGVDVGIVHTKLDALRDWMEDREEEGGIIYFSYTEVLKWAFDMLNSDFPENEFMNIGGTTTAKKRKKIQDRLEPGKFLFMTRAGGQSLNLDAVNNLLFYDTPGTIGDVSQIAGRIIRCSSQFENFNIHFLNTLDTIDEYNIEVVMSRVDELMGLIGGANGVFDPNLPTPVKALTRSQIIDLRKRLLWKLTGSLRKRRTKNDGAES